MKELNLINFQDFRKVLLFIYPVVEVQRTMLTQLGMIMLFCYFHKIFDAFVFSFADTAELMVLEPFVYAGLMVNVSAF